MKASITAAPFRPAKFTRCATWITSKNWLCPCWHATSTWSHSLTLKALRPEARGIVRKQLFDTVHDVKHDPSRRGRREFRSSHKGVHVAERLGAGHSLLFQEPTDFLTRRCVTPSPRPSDATAFVNAGDLPLVQVEVLVYRWRPRIPVLISSRLCFQTTSTH